MPPHSVFITAPGDLHTLPPAFTAFGVVIPADTPVTVHIQGNPFDAVVLGCHWRCDVAGLNPGAGYALQADSAGANHVVVVNIA